MIISRILFAMFLLAAAVSSRAAESRSEALFEKWRQGHAASVAAFEKSLRSQGLLAVVPLHELLRSASDWERCESEPYAVPPEDLWPSVKSVLGLLRKLQEEKVLGKFSVVSAYRGQALNECAGGSKASAHLVAFAVDLERADGDASDQSLCEFWREEGAAWRMGLSRYPSGRVHIDTHGYRTWGSDHTFRTSFCTNAIPAKSPAMPSAERKR